MAKIIGLRGTDLGDDAEADTAAALPSPSPPAAPRPAMTLAGTLVLAGSIGLVGYMFYWAAFGKGKKAKKSGFARNGRRRYRKRGRARAKERA